MCALVSDYQQAGAYDQQGGLYDHQQHPQHLLHQPQPQLQLQPQQQQQHHHQQQPPPYAQSSYWEPLPSPAPPSLAPPPPLNPIPVPPPLDGDSRKRIREEGDADEENAKRLAAGTAEVSFRLLVPPNRVGMLIGKQGMNIRQLRDETGARIRIADAHSPVEERVVLISSKDEVGQVKCAAERALIRVVTLLVEPDSGDKGVIATIGPQHHAGPNLTRFLISGSQAGCVIGKGGASIKDVRDLSGATVRILPREQLPPCSSASESDRLMQISGEIPQVQRAVELVAARLRENPPREVSNSSNQGLYFSANAQQMLFPDGSQITLPDMAAYSTVIQQPDGTGYVVPLPIIPKVTAEMTVPSSLIGGVIGRGGANITQIRQLSGATVKVRGQKDGAAHRVIYFEGSSEQVSVAQSLVEGFLAQQ